MAYLETGVVFLGGLCIYLLLFRPRQLRWGATDEEIERHMSGDEIVATPSFNATRAVSVKAPPENIWPWLVQIGCKRAGWYSYDWIDNLGIPSADCIIPELQEIRIGQLIPLSPNGKIGFYVKDFRPNSWVLWTDIENTNTWYWGIYPSDPETTRLITRVRLQYRWLSPTIIFSLLLDVGDIVMMRRCMLGIKRRAELLTRGGSNDMEELP